MRYFFRIIVAVLLFYPSIVFALDSTDANVYYNNGIAYTNKGQHDKAIENYSMAIVINPNFAEAYAGRGAAYADKGQYDRAIEDCNTAILLSPNYADAYAIRGRAYADKGQYDGAIKDYNKAISIDPNYAMAYFNRGNVYAAKGQYGRAIEDYNKAIALNLKDAEVYYNIGLAYANTGQNKMAIFNLQKACNMGYGNGCKAAQWVVKNRPLKQQEIIMHFLFLLIIGALIAGIVNLIRYTLWKDEVPSIISNLRWIIAITIGMVVTVIEVVTNWNIKESTSINAFLVVVVAQSLKNKSKDKNGKTESIDDRREVDLAKSTPKSPESNVLPPKTAVYSSSTSTLVQTPPNIQESTVVDEDHIYAAIARELETGTTDKGLWTRLFAECGGDEKQTKVLYIKQRAEQLISVERVRLEQVAQERAAEARTAKLVQRKTMELSSVIEQLRLKGYQIKKITSGWKVREPLGGRVKLRSDGALLEYASGQVGAPTVLKSQLPRHREVPHSNDGKNLEDISDEIIPLFDDENSDKNKK